MGGPKKKNWSEFVSRQICCLGGRVGRWVGGQLGGPKKNLGLNLYQINSGVISFWVGGWLDGWLQEKVFGLNLYQAKSGVISFCVFLCWWMDGCTFLRNHFQSELVLSQIWCYLISGGGGGVGKWSQATRRTNTQTLQWPDKSFPSWGGATKIWSENNVKNSIVTFRKVKL